MRSRCTSFVSRRNLSNNFLSSFDSFDLISLFDSIIGKKKFGKGILNKVYHILYKIGGMEWKIFVPEFFKRLSVCRRVCGILLLRSFLDVCFVESFNRLFFGKSVYSVEKNFKRSFCIVEKSRGIF